MSDLNTKNLRENFRRVYIELLFLLLLTKEDMYGFQLSSELKAISNGFLILSRGLCMHLCTDLLTAGTFPKKVQRGKRQLFIYYHIEPKGYEYLNSLLKEEQKTLDAIAAVKNIINYKNEGWICNQY